MGLGLVAVISIVALTHFVPVPVQPKLMTMSQKPASMCLEDTLIRQMVYGSNVQALPEKCIAILQNQRPSESLIKAACEEVYTLFTQGKPCQSLANRIIWQNKCIKGLEVFVNGQL